jgi:hypothetical protein
MIRHHLHRGRGGQNPEAFPLGIVSSFDIVAERLDPDRCSRRDPSAGVSEGLLWFGK